MREYRTAPRDREELAWAAGFFDGEGCFSFSVAGNYVCVSISQTELEPLERFTRAVGVGWVLGPYDLRKNDRWIRKPQWVYRANGYERVQAIAAMLWFKLSSSKGEQARHALSAEYQRRGSLTCQKGHPKGRGKGCPTCTAEYWRMRRDGTRFETAVPYLVDRKVPLFSINGSAGTPTPWPAPSSIPAARALASRGTAGVLPA